jgi:hypothetical protein
MPQDAKSSFKDRSLMLICLIALGIELDPAGVSGCLRDLGGLAREQLHRH